MSGRGPRSPDPVLRARIEAATVHWLKQAEQLFGRRFDPIEIRLDLGGRSAGMYVRRGRRRYLRYNPGLFAIDPDHHFIHTVPHEVAHYVTDCMHRRRVRPHGAEWRSVMDAFGVPARATGDYSVEGVRLRRERLHAYRCACRAHNITTRRHNQILKRRMTYVCRHCRQPLVPADTADKS